MGRAPCCDKAIVKKGPWSPEEDAKLKAYIEQNGTGGNWIALPQKIGLKRCGKSCRLRWLNYLRPNIRHGGFSEEEDNIICNLYISIGSRWSIIAAQLPGRTDNDIKNYWNTRLKKKLLSKQIVMGQNTTYWPEQPSSSTTVMPVMTNPSRHGQYSRFLNQESLKSLLIKLRGGFSDDNNHQDSHMVTNSIYSLNGSCSSAQHQQHSNSTNNMFSSSSTNSTDSPCSQLPNANFIVSGATATSIFQETDGFPIEIDELLACSNTQKPLNGLESFHAMKMADNVIRNEGSTAESSHSWGNNIISCSSLQGYPQLVSEFETCLQVLPRDHSSFQVSSSLDHSNIELLYI